MLAKGYRILARRYKTPVGEIDLVAERFGTLVFIEVKARSARSEHGQALGAVNASRIARAARYFLARHPEHVDRPMRFDVIFLAPLAWPRHLKGAFETTE